MLTTDQQYILTLLEKSMRAEKIDSEPDNVEVVVDILLRNGLLPIVYKSLPPVLQKYLFNQYLSIVRQSFVQQYEGNLILEELSKNKMDCIALKGWEMRSMYPDPIMRQMVDIDILVRPYNYEKVKQVMDELEYKSNGQTLWMHDIFKKDIVTVEIHKRLSNDSGILRRWEKEMWGRAIPVDNHIYKMKPEDFYMFHFVNLLKDFLEGCLGLRNIVDIWLLQKLSLDMDFIIEKFNLMGIKTFHDRMVKLSKVCFGEEEIDEYSETLLNHAFIYGVYGTENGHKAGRIVSMSSKSFRIGKARAWISKIFPPYRNMKAQFPNLENHIFLLPWYWYKRINFFLHTNLRRTRKKIDYGTVSETDYLHMKKIFEAGGILS